MLVIIAKTLIKQGDPRLDDLFSLIPVISKKDQGEIIEYKVCGDDDIIEPHYYEGKIYLENYPEGSLNLSTPGAVFSVEGTKEIKITLTKEEKQPKKIKEKSTNVTKVEPDQNIKDLGKVEIKAKEEKREGKLYRVIKENKIRNTKEEFMQIGEQFQESDLHDKMTTPKRMIKFGWCVEV